MNTPTRILLPLLATVAAVTFLGASSRFGVADGGDPAKTKRFDYLVREDFFAGFNGDSAAFARAMKLCEDTLAVNPDQPEALVWHGTGVWFQSAFAYRGGDKELGIKLSDSGMAQMDHALELAPKDLGVLIPHAASILAAAPFIPGPFGRMLLEKGIQDYRQVLKIQEPYFTKLSEHGRGELLGGLGTAYGAFGDTTEAKIYLERIIRELPKTEYAKRSREILSTSDWHLHEHSGPTCVGCHSD